MDPGNSMECTAHGSSSGSLHRAAHQCIHLVVPQSATKVILDGTTQDPWIQGMTISRYHEMQDPRIHDIHEYRQMDSMQHAMQEQ